MTSIQLAQRCARNLKETDLARMPATMLLDIVEAINAALQTIYAHLPENQRETTMTETLLAPKTVPVTVLARYSNYLVGTPFTAAMKGCTVRVNDDAQDNEVASQNALLDQFLGQSLTGNATVYSDCIQIFQAIERVSSPVRLYNPGSYFPTRELARDQRLRKRRWVRELGTPNHFDLESVGAVGVTDGVTPSWYLRVHPMPSVDLRVRFEAILSTVRVTFAQVSNQAVNLPVPDRICESALVPIAEARLIRSRHWADPRTIPFVQKEAEEGMRMVRMVPEDVAVGDNFSGTPHGF